MAKTLIITFPRGTGQLYDRIKATKPIGVPISTHARNLCQIAIDAACDNPTKRK